MKKFSILLNKLKKEIVSHPIIYFILGIVIILASFVRLYRLNQILGFYYDQGRDALVIWDLIHKGKFFLIGPTTGIAGIFRGPYYYYLIAPFYLLGGGNPVWPSVFLALTSIAAIVLIYYLGATIISREAGLFAAMISSFSFYVVMASRWLSNPTPMLLLSVILIWMMIKVTQGKTKVWPVISAICGLSLFCFGSSGELFYFLALAIFAVWQYKNLPKGKILLMTIIVFFLTFAPLLFFDIKHEGILRKNLGNFVSGEKNFQLFDKRTVKDRFELYYDVFTNKIFDYRGRHEVEILLVIGIAFICFFSKTFTNKKAMVVLLLLTSGIFGLLFFRGNYGIIYDYYLTGYYLIFILLFAFTLGYLWKYRLGKIFVLIFFFYFMRQNGVLLWNKLNDRIDGTEAIYFGNQKQAIDWIYQDSSGKDFNVDVYVPPVIPYAYDYLFKWYGKRVYKYQPVEKQVSLLYTLYEVDPPHPERLNAWLARQKGIGRVEKEEKFGGITVQRRNRI